MEEYRVEPPKMEECPIEVGDFRLAGMEEPYIDFVLVLDKMHYYGVEVVRVALMTTWRTETIQTDILIKKEESGLPSDVWVRTSVAGWMPAAKVHSQRCGKIEDSTLLSDLTNLTKGKMLAFRRAGRTGVVLAASDDIRWIHERNAMRRLNKMGAGYLLDGVIWGNG